MGAQVRSCLIHLAHHLAFFKIQNVLDFPNSSIVNLKKLDFVNWVNLFAIVESIYMLATQQKSKFEWAVGNV